MPRIAKWLVVAALALTMGLHWAVLQSAAWVGMAVSFAQRDSLGVALDKTFDGQHPCQLCKFVEAGKKSESKEAFSKTSLKLDGLCAPSAWRLAAPQISADPLLAPVFLRPHSSVPPVPPPRAV
jgi:hypothetical protein